MQKALLIFYLWIVFCSCESNLKKDGTLIQTSSFSDKIDTYIDAWVANKRFSGNLFIAKGDSILYSESFGLANREFDIANSESTKFLIGSITKTFTAYGILLLEQKGKLSLDDKLSIYFPDFPNSDRISIKHLLTHTSGITDYHAFDKWRNDSKLAIIPEYTLTTLLERPSIFEPGQRFSYTNSGYIFLGLIIEQVSGQTFDQFIREEVLDPIGLSKTGIASNSHFIHELASGYTSTPREVLKAEYINYNQPFASGNMYSTPNDLWKFTQALMNNSLLPTRITKEIFASSTGYGYGWGIRNYDGDTAYGHFGAMNGFVGAMTFIPEGEYFVCFLTNDDNTPEYTIMEDLIGMIKGQEISLPKRMNLIPLTDQMKRHVIGDYLVKEGDTLRVFERENGLFLRETGQLEHELFPIDSLEYAFTLFEFNAVFSEPVGQVSDTLRFIGKSNVIAKRISGPNSVFKK